MVVDFLYTTVGLEAKFTNLSTEVPDGNTYLWDFGDKTPTSSDPNPSHKYEASGFFKVTLTVLNPESLPVEGGKVEYLIAITDKAKTHLSGSIYQLIDIYIPKDIFGDISTNIKRQFINKWQLYLQPLVNHEVPLEEYSNELYYEALENQLIMELAAYDYMAVTIANMIKAQSQSIYNSSSSSNPDGDETGQTTGGEVKKIQTGPTEVEYFDPKADQSDISSVVTKALSPGGLLDTMKENLCMLASRLEIYLPICNMPSKVVVPKTVNKRQKGPLSGPDPFNLLR